MKRLLLILVGISSLLLVSGQGIRHFSIDTATYVDELRAFTGNYLETTEIPDFERFVLLFDSLAYEQQLEIMVISNLMLTKRCRPRPHFINYQRIILEFFEEDKLDKGYAAWTEGTIELLNKRETVIGSINLVLSGSLNVLDKGILYSTSSFHWKLQDSVFQFRNENYPVIYIKQIDLACYSGEDMIEVEKASGRVDPISLHFDGEGGRVNWERAGLPESEMNAELGTYHINLKSPGYTDDSVSFFYPARVQGRIPGKMEDKVTRIKKPGDARYPKFNSYGNDYRVDNEEEGLRFRGGLAQEGAVLLGSGSKKQPALLEIYADGELRIKALSQRIVLNQRHMRSQHTEVSIYFANNDSIYHPDQQLSFDIESDELRLNKTEDFKSLGPYSNSYHGVDMSFDEFYWNRNDTVMRFQAVYGSSVSSAIFESNTFFDFDFFMELQGQDYEHPLAKLYMYSNMLGSRDFGLLSYSDWLGYSPYQVRHLIMGLSRLGFLYYDDETEIVMLRQKLFDYISASMRQRDYDVIRFVSRTEASSNATLNLLTYDLDITGIPVIFLSSAQDVRLMPEGSSISMKRNKSFQFNGVVDAGLFRFSGEDFSFDYQSFKINLSSIDSMQLAVKTGDYNEYGDPIIQMIDNAFEQMTGVLFIDEPQNKSGLKDYPEYPIFTCFEGAHIFFDKKHIQDGVYKREDFYFQMDPFTIDSLDNFNPRSIAPDGTFISAGILPPMRTQMTLRDDNSMGFITRSPEEGFPLYGGLGIFHEDIEMSSAGLRGYGTFDFLTSTTNSDRFLMHPDSMMVTSRNFLVREKSDAVAYPYVQVGESDMKLYSGTGEYHASEMEERFKVFNDSAYLSGSLVLDREGLEASGLLKLPEGQVSSEHMNYGYKTMHADSAGIAIGMSSEYPFLADDLEVSLDIAQQSAIFEARKDATLVDMPYNLYQTRLDHLEWDMGSDEVLMKQEKQLEEFRIITDIDSLQGYAPDYLSMHPGQDSLHFAASTAIYNYRNRKLLAKEVPFVEVADALIFPFNGELEVGYQASIALLEDASLLTRNSEKEYLLYEARLAINGAYEYAGAAYYDYTDLAGRPYPVFFNRVWVDTTHYTRGLAKIGAEDTFMLGPRFDFKGDVRLLAENPLLNFDGGVRLVHDCPVGKSWMRFTSDIDPFNIHIPVAEQMINTDLNKIFAGSMITRDSTHVYSTFLSGRKDYFDTPLITASGELIYNEDQQAYQISTPEKLADRELPGAFLEFKPAACLLYGEGPVDLNVKYGRVELTHAGHAYHDVEADVFSSRLLTGLDFPFSEEALLVMGHELDSLPDLEPTDLGDPHYLLGMRDLLGAELAGRLEREQVLYGSYGEIPEQWWHTIFFNDMKLNWNQDTRSFRYSGLVGIGNIGDVQVNKKVNAYMEFVEKGSGDQFDIYLEASPNVWYYIAYVPGGLQVLSSNREFNRIVFELKANDRRIKGGVGKASYIYSLAAQRRLDLFKERFLESE